MIGPLTYLAAVFFLAVTDVSAKWLTTGYGIAQLLLIRAVFGFIPILLIPKIEGAALKFKLQETQVWVQILRGLTFTASAGSFFAALRFMPLVDVIGVTLVGPVIMVLMAAIVLRERLDMKVIFYTALALLGVVVIIRPTGEFTFLGGVFAFSSAFFYALTMVVTRHLAKTNSTFVTSFITNSVAVIVSVLWLLTDHWTPISGFDLVICMIMGLAGSVSNVLYVIALKLSEVSRVAVLDYTVYIWAGIMGLLFFGEIPTILAVSGSLLIMFSGYKINTLKGKTKPG